MQTFSAKNIKRINGQINWGMKVYHLRRKYKHLPAELINSTLCLMKLHTGLNQWGTSETATVTAEQTGQNSW